MQCPVCRAEVEQGPLCRRCRADLSMLFALDDERRHVLATAVELLQQGRYREAAALAARADAVRSDRRSRQIAAVAHLLYRDFAAAWRWYQAALALPS